MDNINIQAAGSAEEPADGCRLLDQTKGKK